MAKKMARFVSVIGTGLNGSGMDNGPRMQITAVISPISVICLVLVFVCPGSVSVVFIIDKSLF